MSYLVSYSLFSSFSLHYLVNIDWIAQGVTWREDKGLFETTMPCFNTAIAKLLTACTLPPPPPPSTSGVWRSGTSKFWREFSKEYDKLT